jgi:hypothetical protein
MGITETASPSTDIETASGIRIATLHQANIDSGKGLS